MSSLMLTFVRDPSHSNRMKRKLTKLALAKAEGKDEILLAYSSDNLLQTINCLNFQVDNITNRAALFFDPLIPYENDILVFTANDKNIIRVFYTYQHSLLCEFEPANQNPVKAIYYFPILDKEKCFSTGDNQIRVWDFSTGVCESIEGHEYLTSMMVDLSSFRPGYFAVSDNGYNVNIWNYTSRMIIKSLSASSDFIREILFDCKFDNETIYFCGNNSDLGTIKLDDALVKRFPLLCEAIFKIKFLTRQLIVALVINNEENVLVLWNYRTRNLVRCIPLRGRCRNFSIIREKDLLFTAIGSSVLCFDWRNSQTPFVLRKGGHHEIADIVTDQKNNKLFLIDFDRTLLTYNLDFLSY